MLANLNTNMKVIVGISSVVIIGIIYAFIKNIFKSNTIKHTDKIIEGNPTSNSVPVSNNDNMFTSLIDSINSSIGSIHDRILEHNELNTYRINAKYYEKLFPSKIRRTMIHLSSKDTQDRSVNEPHTFTFNFGNTNNGDLFSTFNNVINVKCIEVSIPYVPRNIYKEKVNNALYTYLTENSNKLSINGSAVTIEPGFYTIYELIITLNNLFSTITPQPIFSFNNITNSVSIENVTSISDYNFTTTVNNEDLSNNPQQQYPLLHRLGLNYINFNTSASKVTALNVPDLSIHYVDIIMDGLPSIATTKSGLNDNLLIRVPMKGKPGDIIYHKSDYSDYMSKENFIPGATTSRLSSITLDFLRNDGSNYNFEGIDFDVKLEITQVIDGRVIDDLQSNIRPTDGTPTDTPST